MAGRQLFSCSEGEKTCLQELIIKYKLHSLHTIGAGNPAIKKNAWARLTEDYNSIETNVKRTEAQLKKLWDNLKTRRKRTLALEKKERMRTGGGPFVNSKSSTSSELTIDDALDTKKQEMEEELHALKMEEAKWLVKAAEEKYKTAFIERQRAEEQLRQTLHTKIKNNIK